MKVVSGIVSHNRLTAEVSGNRHGVGTSQILGFRIGKQSVQLSMPNLPQIEDGDEVAVAGDVVNGVLIARAYRNFANNAHGQWRNSWLIWCAVTAIFFVPLGWVVLLASLSGHDSGPQLGLWVYLVPMLPFPCFAVSQSLAAMKTAWAARMVWSVDG